MPAVQRGQVFKLGGGTWAYRYYDREGRRRQQGGFRTKGAASEQLRGRLDERRNGRPSYRLTVGQLVDRYLAQHETERALLLLRPGDLKVDGLVVLPDVAVRLLEELLVAVELVLEERTP